MLKQFVLPAISAVVLLTGCADDGARDQGRDALDSAAAFARDSLVADSAVPLPAQPGVTIDSTAEPTPPPGPDEQAPEVPPVTTSEWTTGIAERKSQAGAAVLRAVRAGRQEGFDRIVFEFGGDAAPGYHVSYIDRPVRACGSGEVVPMPGDGWLEIRMQPAQAHTDAGQPTVTERTRTLDLPNLRRLTMTCDFEADVTWVGGVLSPNDFRVLSLRNPARLVVDIRHR